MNSNNIYSILGKLASLTPKEEPKSNAPSLKEYAQVPARGSVLEGVDAVEARLKEKFKLDEQNMGPSTGGMEEDYASMGTGIGAQGGVIGEKAPPGMEPMVRKLKKEYPGHPEKAFATAWSIYNKKHGKTEESREACPGCNECSMHEDPQEAYESAKPDFLDLDNDGDTDEPMKKASKETHKTDKGEVTRKDGVTSHRRTELPGYSSDDDEESEDERRSSGKRGRPRKAQTKKPRPTGEKKGRGRPKKSDTGEKGSRDSDPFSSKNVMGHDPFGRVKATSHKKASGTKVKGTAMSDKAPKGSPEFVKESILESVNFKRMMDETSTSLDEMIECLNKDMNDYKLTGNMSDRLRDFMHLHHHAKKQMEEQLGNLPPSQVPGKEKLLKTPATPAQGVWGKVKDTLGGIKDFVTGKPEDPTRPTYEEDLGLEEELNELARLAGLSTEGNAFGAQVNAKKHDNIPDSEQSIEIDGEELPVKEADVEVQEPVQPVNNPKKKFFSMKNSTMAPGEGDFGEKNMYGGRGDNPMTQQPKRPAKPVISLEAKLAQEYESIKKSK